MVFIIFIIIETEIISLLNVIKYFYYVQLFSDNIVAHLYPVIYRNRIFISYVKNTFFLRSQIYSHAKDINYKIDEYCVRVNGCQIFKEYTTRLKEQSGASLKNYDEISKLEFKDFRDNDGNLIAWMWVGLSRFEKQIPSIFLMADFTLSIFFAPKL